MTSDKKINSSSTYTPDNNKNIRSTTTPQKLTTSSLNKLASQFNEKKKVYFELDGEQFEILVSNKFRESKIREVYAEYITILQKMKASNMLNDETIIGASYVLNTLLLKEFTNLPIPKLDDVRKLVKVTLNLVDLGIVEYFFGENSPFGEANMSLLNRILQQASDNISKSFIELGLMSEINQVEQERIDIDNYFAELEARNFEITEDEDIEQLIRVLEQLEDEGKYDDYMQKFSVEEMKKLNERLNILRERQQQSGDKSEMG
jgi:hypothetical protein